jgi:hypothetical protein
VEHVVFFTGAEGAVLFRRMPTLEEAVRFVEHLRNVEGVEDSRVFSMTEVPLTFKTVYRVEIPGQADAPAPLPPMPPMPADLEAVADAPAEAPAEPVAEPVAEAPEPVPADDPAPVMAAVPGEQYAVEVPAEPVANGKRGTGFFSR